LGRLLALTPGPEAAPATGTARTTIAALPGEEFTRGLALFAVQPLVAILVKLADQLPIIHLAARTVRTKSALAERRRTAETRSSRWRKALAALRRGTRILCQRGDCKSTRHHQREVSKESFWLFHKLQEFDVD
jgi:hypothetical protein